MRRLQPPIWSKGTSLSPQHLQQQDAYIEDTTRFQVDALAFRPWGFQTLRLDREALAGGYLAINAASGMFSDGLVFSFPESDATPEPLALGRYFGDAVTRLVFYLAIPHQQEHEQNITSGRRDLDARYRSSVEIVKDENTGVTEKPVQVARKNFRIMPAHESREGLSVLPIARITRTPAGMFDLDDGFVPPLLHIGASNYVTTIARRLVEILAARCTALSGARRQKGNTLGDLSAAEIPNFWLLYNVNTWLPIFRHSYENGTSHPEALFSAMTALAGSLTAFSDEVQPHNLAAYDHENLGDCFSALDKSLRYLLENAVPRNFVSLPLKLVKPSIYAAAIDDDRYISSNRLYVAIRSGISEREIAERAPRLVKISSANHMEHLVRQALPGLELTHVPLPPGAVPVKLDFQYFSLQQTGPEWESIVRARSLAAYVPSEIPNPELELVILLS